MLTTITHLVNWIWPSIEHTCLVPWLKNQIIQALTISLEPPAWLVLDIMSETSCQGFAMWTRMWTKYVQPPDKPNLRWSLKHWKILKLKWLER